MITHGGTVGLAEGIIDETEHSELGQGLFQAILCSKLLIICLHKYLYLVWWDNMHIIDA